MKKFSKNEKIYMVIVLVLLALLIVKSVFLDKAITVNTSEMNFSYWVHDTAIPQEFGDGFVSNYVLVSRLVKISVVEDENNQEVFVGKIRRYLFGILPVQEKKVMTLKSPFE